MRAYSTIAALAALLAVLAASAGAQAAPDLRVTDLIVGRGATGPYALSWTNIDAGSEWISVDGMSLVPQIDYQLDAPTGTIAFTQPLAETQTARAVYFRRPDSVKRQAGPGVLALTTPTFAAGRSAVSLTASYSEAGSAPAVSYGLKAKTAPSANSSVETTLLVSHREQQGNYGPGAIGWRTAASTTVGGLKLSGAFARAGEGFADAAALGLGGSSQLTTAQAEYQAAPHLTLGSSYASSQSGGIETVSDTQSLSYKPAASLSVTATRGEQKTAGQLSQTDAVELTSKPADRIDLRARYRQSDVGSAQTTTQEVETDVRPTSTLTLGAGWVKQESAGSIQGQKARVAWAPSKQLKLEGEYLENPEDPSGLVQQATASRLGVTTSLGRLGLTASTWSKDDLAGRSQRHDLGLTLALSPAQKLLFGYSIETSPAPTSSLDSNKYTLGYSVLRGSDFTLSIQGHYLTYRGSADTLNLEPEAEAEARLSTRF